MKRHDRITGYVKGTETITLTPDEFDALKLPSDLADRLHDIAAAKHTITVVTEHHIYIDEEENDVIREG